MQIRAVTWNLFHGRDHPPEPALRTLRSKLLVVTERGDTHLQVNRDLRDEFAAVLSAAEWDVALLQECPPRWSEALASACDATPHRVLTSRNALSPLRSALATRNPDLLGSWEGGSNLTLLRDSPATSGITERRDHLLRRLPERRVVALTATTGGLCVANLHASTRTARARDDVLRAAELAVTWAGDRPLLFGGDLNVRPERSDLFDRLEERFDLRGATSPEAIDHLLARGLETLTAPGAWPDAARELDEDGLRLRLSDHAPVDASFSLPSPAPASQ